MRCVAAASTPREHLTLSVLTANVIPSALFYVCLRAENVWTALIAALVWCYGATAWRLTTRRPTSMLLMIAVVGLTAKTILAFTSGSTFVYFVQPAVNDAAIALLFIGSLRTARPVVPDREQTAATVAAAFRVARSEGLLHA